MYSLRPLKLKKLRTLLVGVTAISVGFTAAAVYFPMSLISTQNIDNLTVQLNQSTAKNTVLEVSELFNSAHTAHIFLDKISARNVLTLDRRESVEKILWSLLESRPNLTWAMMGYPNGDFQGIQRITEKSLQFHQRQWNTTEKQSSHITSSYELVGQDWRLIKQVTTQDQQPYYAPDRPWYKAAQAKSGESAWTTYVRRTNNQPTLDCSLTLTEQGKSVGVLNLGFDLDQISRSLQQIQTDKKNLVFLTNGKSELLASSDIQETIPKQASGDDEPKLNLLENANSSLLRGMAKEIKNQDILNFQSKEHNNLRYRDPQSGEMYYVTFMPLQKIDWAIGILTPESLYLGEVRKNEIILAIVILILILITLGFGVYLIDRMIVQPVLRLNQAAKQVAEQSFSSDFLDHLLERPDEIGELANTLNEMAQEVDGREAGLRRQVKTLQRETEKNQQAQAQAITAGDQNGPKNLIQRAQALRKILQNNIPHSP